MERRVQLDAQLYPVVVAILTCSSRCCLVAEMSSLHRSLAESDSLEPEQNSVEDSCQLKLELDSMPAVRSPIHLLLIFYKYKTEEGKEKRLLQL